MNQNKKDNLSQLLIFTLSLLGVFLTLYLHFEQANNFEQGCSEGFDCKGVIDSFKILGLYFFKDFVNFFDNTSGKFLSTNIHIFFTSGKFFLIKLFAWFMIPFPKYIG